MTLPAFLKSPYVMGSAGVVGVGGISAASLSGGGSGVDYSEDISRNTESRKNLVSNLSTSNNLKTECFSEFFGSDNKVIFSDAMNPETFTTPKPSNGSGNWGTFEGCTRIQFSSKNEGAFVFQIETTVKNDKVGLALWSFGANIGHRDAASDSTFSSKTGNIVRYYLVFLEKGESSWQVKGGYSWMDHKFANGLDGITLHVKSPNGNIDVNNQWSGVVDGTAYVYKDNEWTHQMYIGSWKEDKGSSGKEVFEGIEVWGDSKDNAEILGRDYSKIFEEVKSNRGYGDGAPGLNKYEYKDGKWHSRMTLESKTLDDWYAPFKGQKGTWAEKPQSANG